MLQILRKMQGHSKPPTVIEGQGGPVIFTAVPFEKQVHGDGADTGIFPYRQFHTHARAAHEHVVVFLVHLA